MKAIKVPRKVKKKLKQNAKHNGVTIIKFVKLIKGVGSSGVRYFEVESQLTQLLKPLSKKRYKRLINEINGKA